MWIILGILSSLVAVILLLGLMLLLLSPGKPKPFLDEGGKRLAGSISEKVFVQIGGLPQGMFISGRNTRNPVLLFLHGGPGMPTYFLSEKFPTGLEQQFTVCYWEQRGGGLSYHPHLPADSLTVEQLIADAIEVTHYLRERFGQEKIYLMGHSWGSLIGMQTAVAAPELYHAYIGVSQIARQAESEKLAYRFMMEQYEAEGNLKRMKQLNAYPILESDDWIIPFFKAPVRDQAMHELGIGTMHQMRSVITEIFLPVMQCSAYSLREKINIWRAKAVLVHKTKLIDQLFATDLTTRVPRLAIPGYFFSGWHDYTVNYSLSKDFLQRLQAPEKGFYTFQHSAHSPMHEEPHRFMQIMVTDVLKSTTTLADDLAS